jgi:beta-fructofuranosidase
MKYQNVYQAGYFIGKLDYENASFEHGDFVELDRGFEFYAPQTTLDEKGRRLMVGWMGVPEQDEDKHPTIAHKWIHALTLPRELKWVDGKLMQVPSEELEKMRKATMFELSDMQLSEDKVGLAMEERRAFEMSFSFGGDLSSFDLDLGEDAFLSYDASSSVFSLHRKSLVTGERETRSCKLGALTELRAFMDTSSIEVFLNDGEEVFTARVFPDVSAAGKVRISGSGTIERINAWEL